MNPSLLATVPIVRLQSTPSWLIFQTNGNHKASIPYFWFYWATDLKIRIYTTISLETTKVSVESTKVAPNDSKWCQDINTPIPYLKNFWIRKIYQHSLKEHPKLIKILKFGPKIF